MYCPHLSAKLTHITIQPLAKGCRFASTFAVLLMSNLWTAQADENQENPAVNVIAPIIQTTWNQSGGYAPNFTYNNKTPLVGDGQPVRAPVGCIAVAFGQVLNFYQYPKRGTGYKEYCNSGGSMSGCSDPVVASFYQEQYQWPKMSPSLNSFSEPESIDAVSTLLFHIGASVGVTYGKDGSAAKLQNPAIVDRFKLHFGMSGMQRVYRQDYDNVEWFTLINEELSSGRPVVMVGTNESLGGVGHAYIVDGMNAEGQVHINWGWGGHANGYYDLNTLESPYGSFTDGLEALIKFSPNVEPEGAACHGSKGSRCEDGLVCVSESTHLIIKNLFDSEETGICKDPSVIDVVDELETVTFEFKETVIKQQWIHLGPFVTEDKISVTMTGDGDADLYVGKNARPTTTRNDCSSRGYNSDEFCELNGVGEYHVSIRGFANESPIIVTVDVQKSMLSDTPQ